MDAIRHLSIGVTQYDYLETLGAKLGGQARRVFDNYVDKWDHTNAENPNYEDALTIEANRAMWRSYYKRKAVLNLRQIQPAVGGAVLVRPDELENLVEEPAKLDDFLSIIQDNFEAASAIYLEDLNAASPTRDIIEIG